MPTVVITGATGFLGRFLTANLANRSVNIIPVSRRRGQGAYQVQDYSDSPDGDVLVHLAEDPNRSRVNALGEAYLNTAARVVKALCNHSPRRMIYASSGAVYGDQSESPYRIDMPVTATDLYSRSKLTNEQMVLDSGGVVVRLSNLYGEGMATSNVLSDILGQIPGKGPLSIRDGGPIRDFLHVSDAAAALSLLIDSDYRGIANVGSGSGISVEALAKLALALAGEDFREVSAMESSSRRSINVLDISETVKTLGWKPVSSLRERLGQLLSGKAA